MIEAANVRLIRSSQELERVREQLGITLKDGGGGGTSGGMEARVAKLESDVGHILTILGEVKEDVREVKRDARTDFRLTWAALITGFIGIAAMMAKGFGWL